MSYYSEDSGDTDLYVDTVSSPEEQALVEASPDSCTNFKTKFESPSTSLAQAAHHEVRLSAGRKTIRDHFNGLATLMDPIDIQTKLFQRHLITGTVLEQVNTFQETVKEKNVKMLRNILAVVEIEGEMKFKAFLEVLETYDVMLSLVDRMKKTYESALTEWAQAEAEKEEYWARVSKEVLGSVKSVPSHFNFFSQSVSSPVHTAGENAPLSGSHFNHSISHGNTRLLHNYGGHGQCPSLSSSSIAVAPPTDSPKPSIPPQYNHPELSDCSDRKTSHLCQLFAAKGCGSDVFSPGARSVNPLSQSERFPSQSERFSSPSDHSSSSSFINHWSHAQSLDHHFQNQNQHFQHPPSHHLQGNEHSFNLRHHHHHHHHYQQQNGLQYSALQTHLNQPNHVYPEQDRAKRNLFHHMTSPDMSHAMSHGGMDGDPVHLRTSSPIYQGVPENSMEEVTQMMSTLSACKNTWTPLRHQEAVDVPSSLSLQCNSRFSLFPQTGDILSDCSGSHGSRVGQSLHSSGYQSEDSGIFASGFSFDRSTNTGDCLPSSHTSDSWFETSPTSKLSYPVASSHSPQLGSFGQKRLLRNHHLNRPGSVPTLPSSVAPVISVSTSDPNTPSTSQKSSGESAAISRGSQRESPLGASATPSCTGYSSAGSWKQKGNASGQSGSSFESGFYSSPDEP